MTRDEEPQPGFATFFGPAAATVASHGARTLTEAGDHHAAERYRGAELRRRDPSLHPRVQSLSRVRMGKGLAVQGRCDEAVAVWRRSVRDAEGIVSGRLRSTIRSVVPDLIGYERRGVPGAAELRDQLRSSPASGRP